MRDKESDIFSPGEPPAAAQPAQRLLIAAKAAWLMRYQTDARAVVVWDELGDAIMEAEKVAAAQPATEREALRRLIYALRLEAILQPPAAAPPIDQLTIVARVRRFVERMRLVGGIPEYCELAWKLCNENEELKAQVARLRALQGTEQP